MKCDKCGDEYEGEALWRISQPDGEEDKAICLNCALTVVDTAQEAGLVEWLEATV